MSYKSKLEKTCAELLSAHGLLYKYEPQKVTLVPAERIKMECWERVGKQFQLVKTKQRAITYTPDFVGDGWVIETKGYEKESSRIKWKLFKYILNIKDSNIMLFKPHTKEEIIECIKIIEQKSPNKKITELCQ